MNKEDIKSGLVVRNKKYMTEEVIIGIGKMKIKNRWIKAIIYSGKDRYTNLPSVFIKSEEDFIKDFDIVNN